jgi:hypothetical protein
LRNKLFFIFLLLSGFSGFSQSVVYYPFNSLLSVSTNPSNVLWLDVRFQTNSYFSSLSTEIAPAINLNRNPKARFYIGGGAKMNFLNQLADKDILEGYFMNVGVRSSPFEKYKKIQIAFEISPYAVSDFELGVFRTHLGIGYNFSR